MLAIHTWISVFTVGRGADKVRLPRTAYEQGEICFHRGMDVCDEGGGWDVEQLRFSFYFLAFNLQRMLTNSKNNVFKWSYTRLTKNIVVVYFFNIAEIENVKFKES